MRVRTFLLAVLCLTLAFNGVGAGNAHAHGAMPSSEHIFVDEPPAPMLDAGCEGHDHYGAAQHAVQTEEPHHDHSGSNCCKSASCGCTCATNSFSIPQPDLLLATAFTGRGIFSVMANAAHLSRAPPDLFRPPILQAI